MYTYPLCTHIYIYTYRIYIYIYNIHSLISPFLIMVPCLSHTSPWNPSGLPSAVCVQRRLPPGRLDRFPVAMGPLKNHGKNIWETYGTYMGKWENHGNMTENSGTQWRCFSLVKSSIQKHLPWTAPPWELPSFSGK